MPPLERLQLLRVFLKDRNGNLEPELLSLIPDLVKTLAAKEEYQPYQPETRKEIKLMARLNATKEKAERFIDQDKNKAQWKAVNGLWKFFQALDAAPLERSQKSGMALDALKLLVDTDASWFGSDKKDYGSFRRWFDSTRRDIFCDLVEKLMRQL